MISSAYAASLGTTALPFYQTPTFWVAMAFLSVVTLFARPVTRFVVTALDGRAQNIKTKLEEARKIREDAQSLLADYQRRQRDALRDAQQIMQRAHEEADRLKTEVREKLEETIHNREKQALDRVAIAQRLALKDLQDVAARLSLDMAEYILAEKVKHTGSDALIESSLSVIPEKLN